MDRKLFLLFQYYLSFEKDVVPHFFKLESFFLRMLSVKYGLNWSSGFGEEYENKRDR